MALDSTALNVMLILLLAVAVWGAILWSNTRKMHVQIKQVAHQQTIIRLNKHAKALARAIHFLQPGVHAGVDYLIAEDGPDGEPYLADWLAASPRPTDEQLKTALQKVTGKAAADNYATLRKAEYPSVREQLEAAYEARQGDDTHQRELDAQISRVREKYPKTDENL